MSDHTLNLLFGSLKGLNTKIEKLSQKVDELDILAYRYKRLSYENDQIDVIAFELRQELENVRVWRKIAQLVL